MHGFGKPSLQPNYRLHFGRMQRDIKRVEPNNGSIENVTNWSLRTKEARQANINLRVNKGAKGNLKNQKPLLRRQYFIKMGLSLRM